MYYFYCYTKDIKQNAYVDMYCARGSAFNKHYLYDLYYSFMEHKSLMHSGCIAYYVSRIMDCHLQLPIDASSSYSIDFCYLKYLQIATKDMAQKLHLEERIYMEFGITC